MKDQELIRDFTRTEQVDGGLRILVGSVDWDGPAHATLSWSVASELPADSSASVVEEAIVEILASPEHFAHCEECGELNPLGWMHDERICQSCAQRHHGIVY